jgi:hypothetical protein
MAYPLKINPDIMLGYERKRPSLVVVQRLEQVIVAKGGELKWGIKKIPAL